MTPFEVFHIVTELDDLVSILVKESNLYAQQNGRNFTVTNTEMQAFLKDDKQMKRDDCEFLYSRHTICCKWMDNRSVVLLSTALDGFDEKSTIQ